MTYHIIIVSPKTYTFAALIANTNPHRRCSINPYPPIVGITKSSQFVQIVTLYDVCEPCALPFLSTSSSHISSFHSHYLQLLLYKCPLYTTRSPSPSSHHLLRHKTSKQLYTNYMERAHFVASPFIPLVVKGENGALSRVHYIETTDWKIATNKVPFVSIGSGEKLYTTAAKCVTFIELCVITR